MAHSQFCTDTDRSFLILDGLAARRVARTLRLRVTGTLSVLASKRRGSVTLVRPSVDRLIEQSVFLSPQLYAELIALAGEDSS
jgi:predicted nucleic acid-binding protein